MNARWFAAFSFLIVAVHEAHELVHALAGRLVCGRWAVRDFNSWSIPDCSSWIPTAAGPLFSYALMAIGAWLISEHKTGAGVALLFAANPFARIFTAVMGSGDEMVVAQSLFGFSERTFPLKIGVASFVILVCGMAIAAGWNGMKNRGLAFAVVLLWPMVLTGVALFVIGNRLLRAGVLATPGIGGAPMLVTIVSAIAAVLAFATMTWLASEK